MNPSRTLPLILLFGSMAFSQSPGKQFSSQNFRDTCPIELKASLNSAGRVVPIVPIKDGQITDSQQLLRITLGNPKSEVVAAHITVHGFPLGGRIAPAVLYFPHDPAEITRTISFDQTVGVGQNASISVALPNFSAVTSIDLESVTYSDGSRWHPENRKYCRAVGLPIDTATDALSR